MADTENPDKAPMAQVTLKVPAAALEAYDAAARAAGMSRHRWMCLFLDAAAGRSDLPNQLKRVIEYVPKPVRDGEW